MKAKKRLFLILSAIFALGMLLFTFFTVAWHSDAKGFELGFEIPVGTANGPLVTLADCVWMAAPFLLLAATVFFFFGKTAKKVGILLSCLPLALYALLRFAAFLDGKESHWTLFITMLGMILLGAFCTAGAILPEGERLAPIMIASYVVIELLLLLLSALFREKYSFFYFSQLLPMGHSSHFRYTFFAISPFLYYLFYALSLGMRMLPISEETESSQGKEPPVEPKEDEEEESEDGEDYSSLSLEDLGISR